MIKLNKITDYAVVILGLLSSRYPNKFSTSKISEDTGLPVPTVAKVCKLLNKADLINLQVEEQMEVIIAKLPHLR